MSKISKYVWIIPALGSLMLAGCGPRTGGVSGTLTFKGNPVTSGSIGFHMKNKGIAQDAKLTAAGTFTMPVALPTGTYEVYYIPPTPEPQDPAKGPPPRIATAVPVRYQSLETSGLSIDIRSGNNDVPIDLEN